MFFRTTRKLKARMCFVDCKNLKTIYNFNFIPFEKNVNTLCTKCTKTAPECNFRQSYGIECGAQYGFNASSFRRYCVKALQCDKYKDKSPKMPEIFFAATGFGFLGLKRGDPVFRAVGIFLKILGFCQFSQ